MQLTYADVCWRMQADALERKIAEQEKGERERRAEAEARYSLYLLY